MKSSNNNNNNNSGNCIVTVLDASDLPPLNSNTSLTVITGNTSTDLASSQSSINRNRRHENNNNRNVLHRFLIFHRSDQSQS